MSTKLAKRMILGEAEACADAFFARLRRLFAKSERNGERLESSIYGIHIGISYNIIIKVSRQLIYS